MVITIIGWYGTETVGDRAILAGILKALFSVTDDIELNLGSIYPFFSERTVFEDYDFFKQITNKSKIDINIFDSRSNRELNRMIDKCDLLIVSGGPLMDMPALYLLEYAFKRAKKRKKKTALIGCGLGPLTQKMYIKSTREIINNSDCSIFRDEMSYKWCKEIGVKKDKLILHAICPAAIAANFYIEKNKDRLKKNSRIAFNAREFAYGTGHYKGASIEKMNDIIFNILSNVASNGNPIQLVPMHNFAIGIDDRILLNKLRLKLLAINPIVDIHVLNEPLNLEQTMESFASAEYCIGMRFHSILFQTILNGNNYIIDYTDPERGKTGAFLDQINGVEFYKERYVNLQRNDNLTFELNHEKFLIDDNLISKYEDIYLTNLGNLMLN
ncbi:polysaccharide pyruvyl transferase family protein [Acetobacterium sp.]|uniref:polysaccharide pyruvyl transferase family protein n=1 Tax=Acetobacterium sp. TaxID=1872094 RepID=UPI000CAB92E6|nr:polysaccharide pyruvyl transferase family protein [Acetobacterium sp.]MDO9493750.1 polysaccharide pyruvyl transferase family protein [Acetobacterium sp.]PKM75501.1 MAG: hypothetical protein CVU92_00945 [Firmicutes bacterium HGW-Firmicutes-17]